MFNTNKLNRNFDSDTIRAVWTKAQKVMGVNPNVQRKDSCGAWIRWADYGNTNSQFGWEIDHIYPKSKGGSDLIGNLQPLQWENNRHKGDTYPNWYCKVKAA